MKLERRHYSLLLVLLSVIVLITDLLSGPKINFPVAYVAPVILASWYLGRWWGVSLAVVLSILRLLMHPLWGEPLLVWHTGVNFGIRLIILSGIALLVAHIAEQSRIIRQLKGIISICCSCKRVRIDDGSWQQLESYISEHSDAEFSHGLCSACAVKLYPKYSGVLDR